jgi:UDP-N-acetylmuramoyl-tripeptide--D-alanyl-D-alanine ligase
MIETSLNWIAKQLDGQLIGADVRVNQISTDTRNLPAGAVYLALKGANFNGHDFALQAQQKGALGIIASEDVAVDIPVIRVANTTLALGALGAAVKAEIAPKTVAITGSSGKTTVKEMTAAILSRRGKVLATDGNFNNEIGVPLTLLRLTPEHEFAVMELGANHLGEIAYTAALVKPDVATIVNATAAHLQGFGSVQGVAQAKSEIFTGLTSSGIAVVNGDSQFTDFWLEGLPSHQVTLFSQQNLHNNADFYASDIRVAGKGCAEFLMHTPHGEIKIQLTLPGLHNVTNALVAGALAMHLGASLDDVALGLGAMTAVAGRLCVKELTPQVRLLDDTYNANVASVKAAIDTLITFAGKRILVLGDMGELGDEASGYHQQVGEYAKLKGIDEFYSLGQLSRSASEVLGPHGHHFTDFDLLMVDLKNALTNEQQELTILVKGSRSAKMERVITALEKLPLGTLERHRGHITC